MTEKENGRIVPFPGLEARILDKGIALLKEENYHEALPLFEQLTEMQPSHPQAVHGMAVCHVELGSYDRAEELTERMLRKDIGNYYDVLKLHVSVLIQQRRYQKVTELLQAVMEEDDQIPTSVRQTLNQLSLFARKRLEEGPAESGEPEADGSINPSTFTEPPAIKGDTQQQWDLARQALTQTAFSLPSAITDFLRSKAGDPLVKSYIINGLHEKQIEGEIEVLKLDQTLKLNLAHDELFYQTFSEDVKGALNRLLDSENPSLLQQTLQLWEHFVLTAYPYPLPVQNPEVWAEALTVYAHRMMGLTDAPNMVLEDLHTPEDERIEALKFLESIEGKPDEAPSDES